MTRMLMLILAAAIVAGAAGQGDGQPTTETGPAIAARTVTDYLHAVIEADRTFYTIHVVERLQKQGAIVASQNWRVAKTLPLPAQFLMESSELAARTGSQVRYRLVSAWPINPSNAPDGEFEKTGVQQTLAKPEQPYTGLVGDGKDRRFIAIYADRAVAQACIGCHNAHPSSPKKDFRFGDVMGAVVISIPAAQ